MLYLALSCLQGRTMRKAAEELLGLGVKGLQLTPGLVPTANFSEWFSQQNISWLTHHGFSWHKYNTNVWSYEADCLVSSNSIHPPILNSPPGQVWKKRAERGDYDRFLLETMYPKYHLGLGTELAWAMDNNFKLAVDVSHIYIQLQSGCLSDSIWKRLQQYDRIGELHLSANNGRADIHQPLSEDSFGLDWVRERSSDEMPVILECYMHKLSRQERLQQIELINL